MNIHHRFSHLLKKSITGHHGDYLPRWFAVVTNQQSPVSTDNLINEPLIRLKAS